MKRGKKIVKSLKVKRIKKWRKFESNSFKYDGERCNNLDIRFKFLNFTIESSVSQKYKLMEVNRKLRSKKS